MSLKMVIYNHINEVWDELDLDTMSLEEASMHLPQKIELQNRLRNYVLVCDMPIKTAFLHCLGESQRRIS